MPKNKLQSVRASCPVTKALALMKTDPEISIRDLHGKTGLTYNQASLLKKSSGDPAVLNEAIKKLTMQHLKDVGELTIASAMVSEHHTFKVTDNKPIGIAFLADMHIGNSGTSLNMMQEDFETVRDTPGMYALMGGDYTDNFIKESILSATISAISTPSQQLIIFEHLLNIIEPKIIAMISGNHDLWTTKLAGIDVVDTLCKSKKLKYAPHQIRVALEFASGMEYGIGIRHQTMTNSNINPSHTVKNWRRVTTSWPWDVGCVCHNHAAVVENFVYESAEHWAVRPGSYKIMDDYAAQAGFPRAVSAMPVVIFYPNERRMLAFSDIRSGAEVLTALRNSPSVVKNGSLRHNERRVNSGKKRR